LIVTQGGVPVADQAQGIADFREACRTASPQEAAQMQQNEFLVSQLQERIRNYERSRQAAQNVFDHQKVLSIVSRALRMADATEVMMVIVRKWIDTKYLSAEEFEAFKKAAKAVEEASECTQ
jgi:hypothetical protein